VPAALLIAYQFPPFKGSSGVQRTLRFAKHLPEFGWKPIVLTISPNAYERAGETEGNEVPTDLVVHRAFGLDTARHLSVFGRYPGSLALPDRWALWRFWAVPAALRLIAAHDARIVWSTFPIATAHRVGMEVARRSGLPWIAEFRDPMWQGEGYPSDPRMNDAWKTLEREVFRHATRVVVTTPGAKEDYATRFRWCDRAGIDVIENGFDEETFRRAERTLRPAPRLDGPITVLHSGVIYPSERDPSSFFAAIARMKSEGSISASTLRVVLRASGNEIAFRRTLASLEIADIVTLEPAIDYLSALREMMSADALLILQASNCNSQVPAKLYEYLRANRPIVALTDPQGDTAGTLAQAGTGLVARLDSPKEIARVLAQLIAQVRSDTWTRAPEKVVAGYSRREQAGRLARLMKSISST
jgi:glycosyltransferase involved in cell wall biosynthesis